MKNAALFGPFTLFLRGGGGGWGACEIPLRFSSKARRHRAESFLLLTGLALAHILSKKKENLRAGQVTEAAHMTTMDKNFKSCHNMSFVPTDQF